MHYVQNFKRLFFQAANMLGISSRMLSSQWRQSRLLILCYHGISLADEHEWSPGLYISANLFRARLQQLKDRRCAVLPLGDAIERLYAGTLPPRAVALTFDDGFHDFYALAWPILKEFGWPATVYLTTYYSKFQQPVFDPMCCYLFWKSKKSTLEWPEIFSHKVTLDFEGRKAAELGIKGYGLRHKLSGPQ